MSRIEKKGKCGCDDAIVQSPPVVLGLAMGVLQMQAMSIVSYSIESLPYRYQKVKLYIRVLFPSPFQF